MLAEDNEMLARVGRGTPMGELFRRFWLPALLSSELAEPDAEPRRLRILGEDLVAFRDTAGRVGILDAYCPHRLAPLFAGRNEESGLRCVYHGWKFDFEGNCIDIPNMPAERNVDALKAKVKLTAYPTREAGGVVWVYMGPDETPPEMPWLEWARMPAEHCHVARWLQRTNWAQGMEGEIDSSHISFLHRSFEELPPPKVQVTARLVAGILDGAPEMTLKETPYGFHYGARRRTNTGDYYWRVTQWFAPMFSMIPNDSFPRTGRAWVPVDDHHVMVFTYAYNANRPITPEEAQYLDEGHTFPPPIEPAIFEMPDGYVLDTFLPLANKGNNYKLDRNKQKTGNYSGIQAITDQDRALQENMKSGFGLGPGKIVDRSREMLIPADLPVITARKILLNMAKDLQRGIEPTLPRNPQLFLQRSAAAVVPEADYDAFLVKHGDQMRVE